MRLDELISAASQELRCEAVDALFCVPRRGYKIVPLTGLLAALWLAADVTGDVRLRRLAGTVLRNCWISLSLVATVKCFIGRRRPLCPDDGTGDWRRFNFDTRYKSFPSGHTAYGFIIAHAVATEYPEARWAAVAAYALAFWSGLSRISDNKHWASDVIVGAAVGHAVARGMAARTRR